MLHTNPKGWGVACPGRRSKEGDKALARIARGRHPDHKKRKVVLQEEVVLGRYDSSRPDLFAAKLGTESTTPRMQSGPKEPQEGHQHKGEEAEGAQQAVAVHEAEVRAMMLDVCGMDDGEADFEGMVAQQQMDDDLQCPIHSVEEQPS